MLREMQSGAVGHSGAKRSATSVNGGREKLIERDKVLATRLRRRPGPQRQGRTETQGREGAPQRNEDN